MSNYKSEVDFAAACALWLRYQHPAIIFRYDYAAGAKLSKGMAVQNKGLQMSARGYPDFFIAAPRGRYAGLYIELKLETPFLRDGVTLKADEHLREQQAMLERLRAEGYAAFFIWQLTDFIDMANTYLKEGKRWTT